MNIINSLEEYIYYILAFVLAFFIASIATPISRKIAFKIGAVDHPKERGMHNKVMPLAGGLAIYAGFTITLLIMVPTIVNQRVEQLTGLIIGATLITTVGLVDDIYGLSPKIRIIFQVLSALIVIHTGTSIQSISMPFIPGGQIDFGFMSNFITIFWIVGITNAVNFIDGLDGLATGIASIASLMLMVIAILFGDPMVAGLSIMLTATLAGACMGFLPHNFNPAKIFMGDTGSTFLGFTLAVISIQTMLKTYTALTLIVAVLVLGLPIFDTTFAVLRRLINKKPISQGDRGHLHHRLIDKGLSQKRAVVTLYAVSGAFGIAGILVVMSDFKLALLIVGFILSIWLLDMGRTHFKKDKFSE
ncbi:MraY family glycosyltransferase [Vallitaleaceae bacterium 9-2]